MQICHVNLAGGFRGGERQTELLIRELAARGMPQRLVYRDGTPLGERLAGLENLEIVPIRRPFRWRRKALQGDLIHVHENHAGHLAALHRRRGGPPYVMTRRVDNQPGTSSATERMYRDASQVVAISDAIRKVLVSRFEGLAVRVIPSVLGHLPSDAESVAQLRREWGERIVIGHVGALDNSQKGQFHLIRAMHRLAQHHSDLLCVLVGAGPDEQRFREEARGAPYIRFAGHVNNVGDYLAAFDIFAFPSLHEGLGSSLLDAMDHSLPVVASNVDGIPEIVHNGENGLLVPAGDDNALAEALDRLIADTALRQQLAERGKAMSRNYVPAVMADSYVALYQELLDDNAKNVR